MHNIRRYLGLYVGLALLIAPGFAHCKVIEEIIDLPVTYTTKYGGTFNQPIKVTIFRDDEKSRSPFLLLNHGRAPDAEGRAKLGRARYTDNAKYFIAHGFAVFVPTRVGYGVTGGEDIEDTGGCGSKNYPPGYEAAAQQSLKVIEYAKAQPYIDATKGLVVGQSYGGMTAITLAAKSPPGVLGAINFAGGGGGNPKTRPGEPCAEDKLKDLFAQYGTTARIPTLWFYSENDEYMGGTYPHAWFKAFQERGGKGKFVQLPALSGGGHASFTRNPPAWKPAFEEFIRAVGF